MTIAARLAVGAFRALGALGAFRALCAFRAVGAVRAVGALGALGAVGAVGALGPGDASAGELATALDGTRFHVDLRARYETVDQAGIAETAGALTTRLRAGLETGGWRDTSALIEGVWVTDPLDDYNSTTNGNTSYPVVADPASFAAVNRFALVNRSLDKAALTLGRQRIVIDDQRFIGNVGWRQHEQTFDAARAQLSHSVVRTDVTYATQVNRVFGPDSAAGEWNGDIVLANLSHAFSWGTLTGFAHWLDLDDAAAMSAFTTGVRLTGAKPLGAVALSYAASFARQSDAGANPAEYSASYAWLEGGVGRGPLSFVLGYEVLGGDTAAGFSTPLATLHAFQGWADKFLSTPPAGIEDAYVRIGYAHGPHGPWKSFNVVAAYHTFDSDLGSVSYGDELDVSLVAAIERVRLTLKYASYRADAWLTDTDKLWVSIDYAF